MKEIARLIQIVHLVQLVVHDIYIDVFYKYILYIYHELLN